MSYVLSYHLSHTAAPTIVVVSPNLHWRHCVTSGSLLLRAVSNGHFKHPFPKVPAPHRWLLALPSAANSPIPQETQLVAAGSLLIVFLAHGEHDVCPGKLLYLPGMHGRHDALPFWSWYCPASQEKQDFKSELFVKLPSLQTKQPPSSVTNNPAKQARHDVLPFVSGLIRPVAQVLQLGWLASSWYVLIAHLSHSTRSTRSCLPGRHGRHEAAPISAWYWPDGQFKPEKHN